MWWWCVQKCVCYTISCVLSVAIFCHECIVFTRLLDKRLCVPTPRLINYIDVANNTEVKVSFSVIP